MKKIFITILVLCALLSTLKPDITYSNNENREMQKFPNSSILNAQWMTDFDKYTSDQFIFRDQWLSAKTYIEMLTFKKCINNVYITNDRLLNNYTDTDFDKKRVEYNINTINSFVKKYNAKLYLIPTSSEIYKDDMPFYNNNIDINKKLEGLENYIDMYDVLNKHKDEYIYYNTDHHWTTIGAYYAYQSMFENHVEFNKKLISDEFLGTIHSKLNIKFEPDKIYINDSKTDFNVFYDLGKEDLGLYFDKYLEGKDKYSYFLDNNHGLIQIVNNNINNNKSIVIIKDSFSNCLTPFIAENYKNVYLIDLRYFNINVSTYLKTIKYDDIYIIYNKVNFLQDENFVKFK
jgi:hypothetical protein